MIQLDQLPEHINRINSSDWNKLFGLIPAIEATETFGELQGGDKLPDGTITMPYWNRAKLVDEVLYALNELDVIPVYNWASWQEGKRLLDNHRTEYTNLPIETLCKLFTMIIRADRFSDGYLVGMFANGNMLKIINALKQDRERYFRLREPR